MAVYDELREYQKRNVLSNMCFGQATFMCSPSVLVAAKAPTSCRLGGGSSVVVVVLLGLAYQ